MVMKSRDLIAMTEKKVDGGERWEIRAKHLENATVDLWQRLSLSSLYKRRYHFDANVSFC